jgi:hypothetical protein
MLCSLLTTSDGFPGAAPNMMSELQSVAAGQASVLNSLAEDFPERELRPMSV